MNSDDLAKFLLEFPVMPVVYPGTKEDHPVQAISVVGEVILIANEAEDPGCPAPLEPGDPLVQGMEARIEELEERGQALLTLIHEFYALTVSGRPRHWLIRGDAAGAADWARRAATLVQLVEQVGANPPARPVELHECSNRNCGRVALTDELNPVPKTCSFSGIEPTGMCPACGYPCRKTTAAAGTAAEMERIVGIERKS